MTEKFANIDLHPEVVSNAQMGAVFEELIRKFAELSNETAGEHFTPRDAIRLMVNLIFIEDDEALTKPGVVRSIYDPTAGTGGMLSVSGEHLAGLNPGARLVMYGQELNPESYAICKADMLIKGQDIANIIFGNTLSDDGLPGKHFDYMISNPPFGVEWKKIENEVRKEAEQHGFNGRFGPGLPRVSDGSLLFLMHLPVASVMEVRTFELDLSQVLRTSEEFYKLLTSGGRQPIRGDIIYCRNTANTGTSAYVGTDEPIAMGQDVSLIKSGPHNGRYLNYILHGDSMKQQLETIMVGSTFKQINVADIKALIVVCPPRKEQDAIVDFIESNVVKFDALTAEVQRATDLLRERRTALISAAVTGKIDVRALAESEAA